MLDVVGCLLEAWLASKGFALALSSNAGVIPGVTREQQHVRRRAISELGIGGCRRYRRWSWHIRCNARLGLSDVVTMMRKHEASSLQPNSTPPDESDPSTSFLPSSSSSIAATASTSVTFNDTLPTSTPHDSSTRTTARAPVPPALPTRMNTEPQSDADPEVIPAQATDSGGQVGRPGSSLQAQACGGQFGDGCAARVLGGAPGNMPMRLAICMGTQRDMGTGALEGVHQDLTPQAAFVLLPDVLLQHTTVPHRQHGFAVPPLSGHPVPTNPAHLSPLPGRPHTRPVPPIATTTTTATATIPPTHPPTTTVNPALPTRISVPIHMCMTQGRTAPQAMNATCMGALPPRKEHSLSGGSFFKALTGPPLGGTEERPPWPSTPTPSPPPPPPPLPPPLNPIHQCLLPRQIQYWARVVLCNMCCRDESCGVNRQRANMPWEMYPWEFAKGRRCRKVKYSGEGVSESVVGGTEEDEGGEGRRRAASQHVKGDGVEGRRAREEVNEGTVRASGDRVRVSVSVSELLEAAACASPGPTTHQAPANNNNAGTSTLGTSKELPVARELRKERMMDAHRHRRE
ncbi:hypothetical protein K439DRAFT_1622485 [Ramaria rubella]|nr:hypothetical protein K439DRAFT_1622485 [Ramaria rubella]